MRLPMYLLSKHQRMRRIRKKFHKNRKDPLMNRLKYRKPQQIHKTQLTFNPLFPPKPNINKRNKIMPKIQGIVLTFDYQINICLSWTKHIWCRTRIVSLVSSLQVVNEQRGCGDRSSSKPVVWLWVNSSAIKFPGNRCDRWV